MENAVEALKTAAAVLIFVIAITVSFTMFSRAKTTADAVLLAQDSQEYLESAELESTLYTSSEAISSNTSAVTQGNNATITTDGYRIVEPDDVISTIYRYNLEKYGVTLVELGENMEENVIARFDSNTESVMRQWYNIQDGRDSNDELVTAEDQKENYADTIKKNTTVNLSNVPNGKIEPNFSPSKLEELYEITVRGNSEIKCGAPWYGNETEIIKRINTDIFPAEDGGSDYTLNDQTYEGKGIGVKLNSATRIVEVINEIDNSQYLQDGDVETSLLQQYQLPTIEVVYIIY